MKISRINIAAGVLWIVAVILALCVYSAPRPGLTNPFQKQGKWHKAGLHAHTTNSDGNLTVEQLLDAYKDKGYSIVAITDHRKTLDLSKYCTADFLALSGMETHPKSSVSGGSNHLVCLNIPADFNYPGDSSDANSLVRLVRSNGGEVIYAHPYWLGHNINDLLSIDGYIGIEIFNGVCAPKSVSGQSWDQLIEAGRILPAVAVDDAHSQSHIGKGWVMIKTDALTGAAVIEAIRTGCFYASEGPVIENVSIEKEWITIVCSPVKSISFLGQSSRNSEICANAKETIHIGKLQWQHGAGYVRIEIEDIDGKKAWTNPLPIGTPSVN